MHMSKKRSREQEDDQALYLVLAAYPDHLNAKRRVMAVYQRSVEAVIRAYVNFRGGLNEIQVFEVPNVVFDPDSICPKTYTHEFRFT